MCNTWYLSMPVGTIFAFRINAQATLQHLNDAELIEQLSYEDSENKLMVGYVRDVSPNGLDIGLLVSDAHAYDESASVDPLNPAIRKGLAVQTQTTPILTSTRPRRATHPLFTPAESIFGGASSSNPISAITALPALHTRDGMLAALATIAPSLHPTASLPRSWGRVFAYRPNITSTRTVRKSAHLSGQDDTGALRVPLGARHRLIVGNYSAEGLAARPQTRFSRKEVARAENVMDGLREEEEESRKEKARERELYGCGAPRVWSPTSSPPSTLSSDESSLFDSPGDSLSSCSESSFLTADTKSIAAKGPTSTLPIVIDIILDIDSVQKLPTSPEEFEWTVARLERMERDARRRMGKADSIQVSA